MLMGIIWLSSIRWEQAIGFMVVALDLLLAIALLRGYDSRMALILPFNQLDVL